MRREQVYSLQVIPEADRKVTLAVYDSGVDAKALARKPRPVVQANGNTVHTIVDQIMAILRANGFRPSHFGRPRKEPFHLDEASGVRLALLLLALKPLRKYERIEAIASGIRRMADEEAYYWYSKARDARSGLRAVKALRILLSRE